MSEPDDLWIDQIEIGPMQNFCYVVGSRRTREVSLVDPAWDVSALLQHLDENELTLDSVLITHYHPDHCGGGLMGHNIEGVAKLLGERPVKIYINKHEADGLKRVTGVSDSDLIKVDTGERARIGDVELECLHTPGHTPGSQCFRVRDALVSGDTLFTQGCGRVDLPGSDSEAMYHSLKRLAALPDDTVLLPGHDYGDAPRASFGELKTRNVHLRMPDLETWRELMG